MADVLNGRLGSCLTGTSHGMGAIPQSGLERSYSQYICAAISLYSFFLSLTAICHFVCENDMAILLVLVLTSITLADVYAAKHGIYGRVGRFFYNLLPQLITFDKRCQQVRYAKFDSLAFGERGVGLIQTIQIDNSKIKAASWEFDSTNGYPGGGGPNNLPPPKEATRKKRKNCCKSNSSRTDCRILKLTILLVLFALTRSTFLADDRKPDIFTGSRESTSCSPSQPTSYSQGE